MAWRARQRKAIRQFGAETQAKVLPKPAPGPLWPGKLSRNLLKPCNDG